MTPHGRKKYCPRRFFCCLLLAFSIARGENAERQPFLFMWLRTIKRCTPGLRRRALARDREECATKVAPPPMATSGETGSPLIVNPFRAMPASVPTSQGPLERIPAVQLGIVPLHAHVPYPVGGVPGGHVVVTLPWSIVVNRGPYRSQCYYFACTMRVPRIRVGRSA